jgi:hypothetical protein
VCFDNDIDYGRDRDHPGRLCRNAARRGGPGTFWEGFIGGGPETPRGLLHDDPVSTLVEVLDDEASALQPVAEVEAPERS